METNNTISGKRLTFFQLIQKYNIQIPIIQRDYAQGRPYVNEIRDSFLDALYAYLDENIKNRDLDFVYGNQLNDSSDDIIRFIPLDGQQRLTTLFLLHWYLANISDKVEKLKNHLVQNLDSENPKSKFTYETRPSSMEFCDALIISDIDFNNLLESDADKNNSLSKTIKDSNWYFLSWETDPTIQSMLVMIDDIHTKFKGKTEFFERLISLENPVITFQFLDLKEFNLTDDLYIKMNARGIALTSFENFKAKFEQHVKNLGSNNHNYELDFNGTIKQVDINTYFSHKIDTDWANLFWNHTLDDKKKFDRLIMNFIRVIVVNNYAGIPNDNNFIRDLIDKKTEVISFQQYMKFNCFNENFIKELISILDLIKNSNQKVKNYLSDFYYYNESEIFDTVVNNNFNQAGYVERIKFHAYCQYLITWKKNNEFTDINGLENWMRIIYNLSENTAPYNNEREFMNSIKFINLLMQNSDKIIDYFITNTDIVGFDSLQIKEERLKAILIRKSTEWKELIFSIEQHGYFKGQIGFILFLSGIDEYFTNNSNCLWSEQDDLVFKQKFKNYSDKARKIFDNKGLTNFPDFIWERALLVKGDYLIQEGLNQSFLIDSDRDISWKRFLKRDKNNNHGEIIREIFNDIDLNNVTQSLINIINSYQVNDWKIKFIQSPELFKYLGSKRYIRKESNHGFILLSGEKMSGKHAELYTYSYFIENLKDKTFPPFQKLDYSFISGNDINQIPSILIDNLNYNNCNYTINLFFNVKLSQYIISFFEKNNQAFEEKIIKIMNDNEFELSEPRTSYILHLPENDIVSRLEILCESFQDLSELK